MFFVEPRGNDIHDLHTIAIAGVDGRASLVK